VGSELVGGIVQLATTEADRASALETLTTLLACTSHGSVASRLIER
jgi:hypothetical protein